METPLIRYNLKDRGRQHTGQPRNFDIKAICDVINSPAVQEIVASRGMLGYYGHAPRIRYGMTPVEGGFENGKYKEVQPAIVTTFLRADYNGNVEHQAEFLGTDAGVLAAKLWAGKVGGFSSAIDQGKPDFYGFDYVAQPNFLSNSFRGIAMDDIGGGESLTYDAVYVAERVEAESAAFIAEMLDSVAAERAAANAVIERLQLENESLLSAIVARDMNPDKVLDGMGFQRPLARNGKAERMLADRKVFMDSATLPGYQAGEEQSVADAVAETQIYQRLLR